MIVVKNTLIIIAMLTIIVTIMKFLGESLQQELLISSGKIWILAPGTIIHELSHLIVCILFGLHLNDVSLFRFNQETGELGSVTYSYNPDSVKDRIGVSLSSIAPIFGISAVEYYIYWLLFKNNMNALINDVNNNQILEFIKDFFMNGSIIKTILFIAISILLLSGYSISSEDIRGILSGIIYLIAIIFLLCALALVFSFVKNTIIFSMKMLLFICLPMIILCVIGTIIMKFI